MSHLPIWYLGEFPAEDCDKAMSEFMQIPPKDASMGKEGDQLDYTFRNTTVRFVDRMHWFGLNMLSYGNLANQECKWGWETDSYEAMQFAEYSVGQKYNWHVDNFPLHGGEKDRKITVVCLMSDPSEFDGGELQLRLYGEFTPPLKKGYIIAFPSVIEHQVTPVTRGVRYTATMWLSGPRFK
jgi:PKHD-type hydroxylase